jgi:membrane-bound lytic murein transglycosylase D
MRDLASSGFGSRQAGALAIAGLMGVAAVSGTFRAYDRFGQKSVAEDMREAVEELATAVDAKAAQAGDGPVWDLPNLDHPRIDFWVNRFTTDKRRDFERFMSRSGRYVPMISEKLTERGMPQDLIYLAMIESGFNPTAYSHAHASGLWQFISETGQRYGLTVNRVVDERNDPVKSTDAALDYLTYLHNRFNSWYLAAAGYNTGENRVGRIMREVTGSEKGTDEDFYRIWNRLPRETRDYVPLMIAAARIAKEPAKYGFENVQMEAPLVFDEVLVAPGSSLDAIARAAGAEAREVRRLNPHLKTGSTPTNRSIEVRIPKGTERSFAVNWARVQSEQRAQAQRPQAQTPRAPARAAQPAARSHRVRQGESLSVIAQRNGTTVAALRSANNLRGDRIRVGQTLRIPAGRAATAQRVASRTTQPAARTHRVRQGENLSVIAQRHGTSVTALRSANNLRGDRIRAGQTLRIPAR